MPEAKIILFETNSRAHRVRRELDGRAPEAASRLRAPMGLAGARDIKDGNPPARRLGARYRALRRLSPCVACSRG